MTTTLQAFSALSHPLRLEAFRLLVKAGHQGMAAGKIATALQVRQNTLSNHLGILDRAGLIHHQREGRVIRYFSDFNGLRSILQFLMEDCCGGAPDDCQPLLDTLTCDDPAPDDQTTGTRVPHSNNSW